MSAASKTSSSMSGRPPAADRGWLIVTLLFLLMLVNFADKAVVGIAGVPIMQELHLSPREFGIVGSSFFLLFSLSAVLTGFLVNRVQARWVLLVMALIWALTQFPMIGTVGFGTLVACRIALGAGEGPAWPVALHAAFKWFPDEQRTLVTGIMAVGGATGVLLAPPLLNLIIVHYSWHLAFGALGIIGLAWTAAWLAMGREGPLSGEVTAGPSSPIKRVPYRRLLLSPTIVASWCAFFGAYWGLALVLTWQPVYFVKGLGFSQSQSGLLLALSPALALIVELSGGWYSRRLLLGGTSSRVARGLLGGGGVALGGVTLLVLPLMPSRVLSIVAITVAAALPTLIYVVAPAVVSEITPVAQRGALLAVGNAIGTLAGIIAPYVMGSVIEAAATPLEGFNTGFKICGAIMVAGGVIGIALMRPEREKTQGVRQLAGETLQTIS